jgi:glycosyltransferase involved in cell wall biosynthesis
MKIVHVMNWYVPNMGYEENFLPAEQAKLGHQVHIITSDRIPAYEGYKHHIGRFINKRIIGSGIYEDNDVTIHRLPCRLEVINGDQVVLKGLRRALRELEPDVVQAHGTLTLLAILAVWYSKELGYKVFVDDHLHKNNFKTDSVLKKLYVQLAKLFYAVYGKRVSCWMPRTYAAEEIVQSLVHVARDRIEVTHLGADETRFVKSDKYRAAGRALVGVGADDTLIVTSGKFHESKDIHILVRAFHAVASKRDDVYLLLLGNGPEAYMQRIQLLAARSDASSRIVFKDFVLNSELPLYYNAADLGVWPGSHSITVIEAVATGLPVILPEEDLAYGILFKKEAAVGFKRGDPDSLSESVLKLLHDSNLKSKTISNSLSLVKNTLSWRKIAERSIEIYSTNYDPNAI